MALISIEFIIGHENQVIIVMICGIFLILIIGFKIQSRFPKRFLSDPEDAIQLLIRFQFSNKIQSYMAASRYIWNLSKISENQMNSTKPVRRSFSNF